MEGNERDDDGDARERFIARARAIVTGEIGSLLSSARDVRAIQAGVCCVDLDEASSPLSCCGYCSIINIRITTARMLRVPLISRFDDNRSYQPCLIQDLYSQRTIQWLLRERLSDIDDDTIARIAIVLILT